MKQSKYGINLAWFLGEAAGTLEHLTEGDMLPADIEIYGEGDSFTSVSVVDLIREAHKAAPKWQAVDTEPPTDTDAVYWVDFRDGEGAKLCRLNNYKQFGGLRNFWQDMAHDDHPMPGTLYMQTDKPETKDND